MIKKNKKILYIRILTFASFFLMIFAVVRGFFYAPFDEVDLKQTFAQGETEKMQDEKKRGDEKVLQEEKNSLNLLYPKKLRIPFINVDADVQYMGITRKGNMATPKNLLDVGWFKYGTIPGQVGSAVIAGHVDNGFALPGIFRNLNLLKIGDDVYVDTVGGDSMHFIVSEIKTYSFNSYVPEVFNQDNDSFIKLVTCTGTWLPNFKTHSQRMVVTAVKVVE